MNPQTFSDELKRRNVYKVAAAYAAIAWLLFEAVSVWVHVVGAPTLVIQVLAVVLVAGFVLTVYVSWAFEATPQGMKRTGRVSAEEIKSLPYWSARKFAVFFVTTALLAVALLLFDLLRR